MRISWSLNLQKGLVLMELRTVVEPMEPMEVLELRTASELMELCTAVELAQLVELMEPRVLLLVLTT